VSQKSAPKSVPKKCPKKCPKKVALTQMPVMNERRIYYKYEEEGKMKSKIICNTKKQQKFSCINAK